MNFSKDKCNFVRQKDKKFKKDKYQKECLILCCHGSFALLRIEWEMSLDRSLSEWVFEYF